MGENARSITGKLLLFMVGIASFAVIAAPSKALAQVPASTTVGARCSRCTACDDPCARSDYGGNECTYLSGCCMEVGGNCNPTQTTLMERGVAPEDLVTVENLRQDGKATVLARVSPGVLVQWDCTGNVRALYWSEEAAARAEMTGGPQELGRVANGDRYTLAAYLSARKPVPVTTHSTAGN